MKKLFLLLMIVAVSSISALAQNITVKGTVLEASDQEPVAGATVMAKGTDIGTSTDANGNFTLSVPANCKKLVVTFIGMHAQEVDVKPHVTVYMEEDNNLLDEIVVTGYGQTRKAAFTGAASVIDGEVVDRKSEVNFVKSLEGQVTGFQYNNSTSAPGQYGSVRIRGVGSLNSSNMPLYVIDGIPVNAEYDGMSSSSNSYFDPLSAYNANDIESITVLKDAAATAIYGSRASNGVIVITTKKGGLGQLNVTFETRQGFTSMANNNMKYANAEQMMGFLAGGLVAGGYYNSTESATNYLTNRFKSYGWDGVSSYDWIKAVTRKAYYADYNLSVSGTNGKTNYYINMNYNDAKGLVIGSSNTRYGGRVNLDTSYQWLSAGMNASYSYSVNNAFSQSTGGSMASPIVGATTQMTPFYPLYEADGTYANIGSYNPLAVMDPDLGDLDRINNKTLVANPWLKLNLPYGFWAKTNFGYNLMDQREYNYWSAVYNPQGMQYNGLGQMYISSTSVMTWTNTFGWNHSYGNNNIDILLGQEMQKNIYDYDYYAKYDFPFADQGMRDMATAAADDSAEYYKAMSTLASYFLDAHYDYASKYFLSASYRRDGSSVFGANKRWGNFWSVGAKWRMTKEKWLESNTTLTNADIRVSYGTVGNQGIGYYAARGIYATGYNYDQAPGMSPTQISNPNLTWETSKKFDVGFDLSFINKWHLTFDFYNEDTDDALYSVPLSWTTGMGSSMQNIGKMRNRGIEVGINGMAYYSNDVMINVFANMSWNKNKVVKLYGDPQVGSYSILEEGRPYYQFYMKEYAGVNPENGRAQYYLNAEGDELTEDYNAAAKRYVGSAEPKVFGAFGLSGNAYGFDLAIQFNYRLGSKVYDGGHAFTGWGVLFRTPLEKVVNNSWTPENPNAAYPQYIYGDPYTEVNGNTSSRWLMNGDYLRLSNITFGYTLPSKLTKKAFIQKLRIYTTFDNVYTWKAKDFVGYSPDSYASGYIAWQYPSIFTFTGGIQLTF